MQTHTANKEINDSIPHPIADSVTFTKLFNQLSVSAHVNSVSKGFWDKRTALLSLTETDAPHLREALLKLIDGQQIALMHSELSEALEGSRKNLKDDHLPEFDMLTVELADVVIRIMDHAGAFKLPVGEAIVAKMAYNSTREPMHGGKKF